jgi:hypothetical protein
MLAFHCCLIDNIKVSIANHFGFGIKPFYSKVKRVLSFKLKLAKTQILMTANVISYVIIKNIERYNIYFINREACSSSEPEPVSLP